MYCRFFSHISYIALDFAVSFATFFVLCHISFTARYKIISRIPLLLPQYYFQHTVYHHHWLAWLGCDLAAVLRRIISSGCKERANGWQHIYCVRYNWPGLPLSRSDWGHLTSRLRRCCKLSVVANGSNMFTADFFLWNICRLLQCFVRKLLYI